MFLKHLSLIGIGLTFILGSSPAFAVKRSLSVADLFKELEGTVWGAIDSGDNDCALEYRMKDRALELTLHSEDNNGKKDLSLSVPGDSSITEYGKEDADGSFSHTIYIKGLGKLTLIHEDDAFDSVSLTKRAKNTKGKPKAVSPHSKESQKNSASCEIDS